MYESSTCQSIRRIAIVIALVMALAFLMLFGTTERRMWGAAPLPAIPSEGLTTQGVARDDIQSTGSSGNEQDTQQSQAAATSPSSVRRLQQQPINIQPQLIVKASSNVCAASANKPSAATGRLNQDGLPECPIDFIRVATDSSDSVVDRNADWVEAKYNLYASRCEKRDGLMWSQLSMVTFEKIAIKVLKLLLLGAADADATVYPSEENAKSYAHESFYYPNEQQAIAKVVLSTGESAPQTAPGLSILDWGAGCGVGVRFFSNFLIGAIGAVRASSEVEPLRLGLMGIDLTGGAIVFAKERVAPTLYKTFEKHMQRANSADHPVGSKPLLALNSNISFCHADGTDLSWIPSETFDYVTAFGALLHVPARLMCKTVSDMLRVTKVGGAVWGGYIDDMDTIDRLSQCKLSCKQHKGRVPYTIQMTLINERAWLKRTGMPKALLKRRPHSFLWRKVP